MKVVLTASRRLFILDNLNITPLYKRTENAVHVLIFFFSSYIIHAARARPKESAKSIFHFPADMLTTIILSYSKRTYYFSFGAPLMDLPLFY